jgi:predicted hotdog family 3-hydroxylacyl-ACP dehydratase
MSLSKAEICRLLPHDGAMCLLDACTHWDGEEITCTATSHRDPANPLSRAGVLPALCGIEYVAQAMGVHGGLLARRGGAKPEAGFLASLRGVKLAVARLDHIAGPLAIWSRRIADAGDSVQCEFAVRAGDRVLLSGRATLLMSAGPGHA